MGAKRRLGVTSGSNRPPSAAFENLGVDFYIERLERRSARVAEAAELKPAPLSPKEMHVPAGRPKAPTGRHREADFWDKSI